MIIHCESAGVEIRSRQHRQEEQEENQSEHQACLPWEFRQPEQWRFIPSANEAKYCRPQMKEHARERDEHSIWKQSCPCPTHLRFQSERCKFSSLFGSQLPLGM